MKTMIQHSLCLEDGCTEVWIGIVPDDYTIEKCKENLLMSGRKPLYVGFTDGFAVEMY